MAGAKNAVAALSENIRRPLSDINQIQTKLKMMQDVKDMNDINMVVSVNVGSVLRPQQMFGYGRSLLFIKMCRLSWGSLQL